MKTTLRKSNAFGRQTIDSGLKQLLQSRNLSEDGFNPQNNRVKQLFRVILFLTVIWSFSNAPAANQVIGWGRNDYHQSVPPASITNEIAIGAGLFHSLAWNGSGKVAGWGDNSVGQTNAPGGFTSIVPISATNSITNIVTNIFTVASGGYHGLALLTNGTVGAWGDFSAGQTDVPTNLSNVVSISGGFYHNLALKSDGTVTSWGTGTNNLQDGVDYDQALVPSNLSNVVAVCAGGWHSLVLKSDGTLTAWGRNNVGQGSIPAGLSNIVAISAGAAHNLALKPNGTVTAWGDNTYGQTNIPVAASNVVAIAAGGWHCLALRNDGSVVAWGDNDYPTTGTNRVVSGQATVPVNVTNVSAIAAGGWHSLALAGSGPPSAHVAITNVHWNSNYFTLSIPAHNGRVYQIEYNNSLTNTVWKTLPLVAGVEGTLPVKDFTATNAARVYRMRQW